MSEVDFELKAVEEKQSRTYRRRSKYDPILDMFLEMNEGLVKVVVEEKEANYLRSQLKKRIDKRGLKDEIDASVVNGVCYLEKI
ncbi:MAG: hypothetical protein ACOC56_05920 [Atribacterota bacterium]